MLARKSWSFELLLTPKNRFSVIDLPKGKNSACLEIILNYKV
jgi:hypothetical protein